MKLRYLALAGLGLLMLTGAAAPACSAPASTSKADLCNPTDRNVVPNGQEIARDQACWPKFAPPGAGAAAHGHGRTPGTVHTVIAHIEVTQFGHDPNTDDEDDVARGVAVFGVALAGARPAINAETGMPFLDRSGITTPDTVIYDLGLGVTSLQVSAACLCGPGQTLHMYLTLDDALVPDSDAKSSNPLTISGTSSMLTVHAEVDLPG